jgi:hypothetical protein
MMSFHVALLKKYEGDPPGAIVPLPATLHGHVIPTPAAVVHARLNRGRWQLLSIGRGILRLILLGKTLMTSRSAIQHSSSRTSCLLGRREVL